MTGAQSLVGLGGVGLVGANFWFGGDHPTVSAGLFGSGDPGAAHGALLRLGGEMLLVVVITVLAGVSDTWGTAMAVAIVGLWILWAINHYAKGGVQGTKGSTQTGGGTA